MEERRERKRARGGGSGKGWERLRSPEDVRSWRATVTVAVTVTATTINSPRACVRASSLANCNWQSSHHWIHSMTVQYVGYH